MEIHTNLVCEIMGFRIIESIPFTASKTGKPFYTIHNQDNEVVAKQFNSVDDAIAILKYVQQATANR